MTIRGVEVTEKRVNECDVSTSKARTQQPGEFTDTAWLSLTQQFSLCLRGKVSSHHSPIWSWFKSESQPTNTTKPPISANANISFFWCNAQWACQDLNSQPFAPKTRLLTLWAIWATQTQSKDLAFHLSQGIWPTTPTTHGKSQYSWSYRGYRDLTQFALLLTLTFRPQPSAHLASLTTIWAKPVFVKFLTFGFKSGQSITFKYVIVLTFENI